jgi:hypothetical protein
MKQKKAVADELATAFLIAAIAVACWRRITHRKCGFYAV